MRGVVLLGVIAFAIALAVVVGNQLSAEAMAVVVGVIFGVLASIPMSIMLLILTRRANKPARSRETAPMAQGMAYPPVVVIQPDSRGSGHQLAPPWDTPAAAENQPWRRSFTVVGEEEEDW